MFGLFKKKENIDDVERRLNFSKNLQAVTNRIHATSNLDEIMLDLSNDICDLFHCDRLTLYAVSNDKAFIFSKVKTGIDSNKDLVLPINGESIAGYAALHGKGVCVKDVYNESELKTFEPPLKFCREVDLVTSYRTKQMLAAPLINKKTKEVLGVIQLLNNRSDGAFTVFDEDGLEDVCETMAIAFIQRMKPPVVVHSKYLPLVTDSIISEAELDLAARSARRKNVDIEEVLVDEFQVSLTAIGQALSKTFRIPYESHRVGRYQPTRLSKKLNLEFAIKNQWLPIEEDVTGVTILTTEPDKLSDGKAVQEIFSYGNVFYRVTTKREFSQTAAEFFPA